MAEGLPETILTVDDNEASRYSVCRTLQRAGFRTLEAATGTDALRLVRSGPDLVLLDVRLPDILGFDVCRRIKSDPDTRSVPVVMMSASFVGPDARISGLEGGADAYLAQPVSGEEMIATVKAVLRTREAEREARGLEREAQRANDELGQVLQALEEQKRALETYFEASPLAIVVRNLEEGIVAWNSAAARMFGWSREEALGRTFPFVPEARQAEFVDILDRVIRQRAVVSVDTVRRNNQGKEFDVTAFYAPLTDASGNVVAILSKFQDISDRRRTEEALRSSDRLAAQGRMASMLAHEINNPLASVTNALYLLGQNKNLGSEASNYVQTAAAELARVAHITRQIFALYRDSTAQEQVPVAEVMEELLDTYSENAAARRIKIRREFDSNASVVAIRGELRHLFSNILANAFDHLPEGGTITVRIRFRRSWRPPSTGGCSIVVADNGPGIAREHIKAVFDPFFTTKDQRSAGLGLWVAKGIVDRLNGTIRVRSSAVSRLHGTCVSLFLPVQTTGGEWKVPS